MPIEFCFRYRDNPDNEVDHTVLEIGERSGLYPDDSTGQKRFFGVRCTETDDGVVEIFEPVGILAGTGVVVIKEEDLPPPSECVYVTEGREHTQEASTGNTKGDLVVRRIRPDEIRFTPPNINIPRSLLHPQ